MQTLRVKLNPGFPLQNQHRQTGLHVYKNTPPLLVTHTDVFISPRVVDGSGMAKFSLSHTHTHTIRACLSCSTSLAVSSLSALLKQDVWVSSYKHAEHPDSTFSEPPDCNRETIDSDTPPFFLRHWLLLTMALLRRVTKDDSSCDYIFAVTYSDVLWS